jgi:2-(1,2-epoxy-1,2-dihydrophenyl)acetyl-CoA isomerase
MSEKSLLIERQDKIAILTMNRPATLNALNHDLQEMIMETCRELRKDDNVWAVILTGAGRGFCSGADVSVLRRDADELPPMHERLDVYGWVGRLSLAIYKTLGKPIIGAVNGVAVGAGMSVALACDMRVGTEKTRFKVVFPERSLSPDTGMSYYLPRIVGYSRACDLIMTSRYVEAEEAYRIGLLDRLVPSENLMDEALKLANQIAGLNISRRSPHDLKEQGDSFRERRKPKFTGQ